MTYLAALALCCTIQEGPARDPELWKFAQRSLDSIIEDASLLRQMQMDLSVGPMNHTNIRPLILEGTDDTPSDRAYLGFDYTFSRAKVSEKTSVNPDGLWYFGLRMGGGAPFQDGGEKAFAYHRVIGFYGAVSPTFKTGLVGEELPITKEELYNKGASLMDTYGFETVSALSRSPQWADYTATQRSRIAALDDSGNDILLLTAEVYFGGEFSHDFDGSRFINGLQLGYLVHTGLLSNAFTDNCFDWPFALIRKLEGDSWNASFDNWAINVMGGVEYLLPVSDGYREELAGSSDGFLRPTLSADIGVSILDKGNLRVEGLLSYDAYFEFDAPGEVREAGLAHYSYLESTLRFNRIWSISWKSGMLPYDDEDSTVFAIGLDILDVL